MTSPLLYLDVLDWPFNFDLQPVTGSVWMFHTDFTGIYKNLNPPGGYSVWLVISGAWIVIMFTLYPIWLFLGFKITRLLFFKKKYRILKGLKTISDVKSRSRRKSPALFSVQRNKNKFQALEDGIKAIGGFEHYAKKGDKVVIKANICGGNPFVQGSFADPEMVGVITRIIHAITEVQVVVVDSDMVWTDFEPVAKAQGWYRAAKRHGFKLVNLAESDLIMFDFGPQSKTGTQLASKIMIDADILINIPVMKTHLLTSVTLGMKNFYGTHPKGDKAKYHKIGIEDVVVDMIRAFVPTLTIIDGSIGGQAIGPLTVKPVNAETLVISNDVVLADSIACQIMGYKPEEIVHLWNAHQEGIGSADIQFDFNSLPYSLDSDNNWERPDPEVSSFYNNVIQSVTNVPTVTTFFNYASDVILYDMATLPILRNLTPITLSVLSDAIAGLLHLTKKIKMKEEEKISLGSKVADQVFPMIGQEAWPTTRLQSTLETIGLLNIDKFEYPDDTKKEFVEITSNDEKGSFAEVFMPQVSTVGLELRSETKSSAWSGVQYQVLESKDESERVLQNVLIWTKQKVLFSQFYNFLLPLLLGFLGMLVVSSVKISSLQEGILSILIVSLILSLLGGPLLLQFLLVYIQKREIIYRTPIILPIYGIIFLITIYDIYDKLFSSITILLTIPFGLENIEIVLPTVSMIFFGFAIVTFLLITLFGDKAILASHYMDYGPIWIYLRKKTNINAFDSHNPLHWEIERIYFDAYHYEVEKQDREDLIREKYLKPTSSFERVVLDIDNNWHAFSLSSTTSNLFAWLGVFIGILSFFGLILSPFYFWGTDSLLLILSVLFIILTVSLWLFVARYRSTLIKIGKTDSKESLSTPKKQFSPGKLNILWNLREDHAQLKIRKKILTPFDKSMKWDVFYDIKELHAYKSSELELTRSNIFNLAIMFLWSLGAVAAFIYGNYINIITSNIVLFGFGVVITISLIAVLVIDFEPAFILLITVSSAILAVVDESVAISANLWSYADNTVLFPLFGWPLIIFFIYSIAEFIQLVLQSPLKKFKGRVWNFLLIILLIMGFALLLYLQPDYISILRNNPLILGFIVITSFLGLVYLFAEHFRESVTLTIIASIGAGLMELIGNLSGMWTYVNFSAPVGFSLNYFLTEFPLFVILYWVFRVAVVLLVVNIIMKYLLKKKHIKPNNLS
jgi:uncharacterized protein (DUF362 family)